MYFLSFVINLLAWMGLGLFIGHRTYLALRRRENSIYLASAMGGLFGGILSSMTHGMYPRVGIDLFNLMWAGVLSFATLTTMVPQARIFVAGRIFREIRAIYQNLRPETTLIPR
jgi:predicted lipid-binding transport protein (Tim44 family)